MLEIRERQHLWDFLGLVLLSAAKTRESEVYKEAIVELDRGKKVRTWGLEAEWKPVRKHEVQQTTTGLCYSGEGWGTGGRGGRGSMGTMIATREHVATAKVKFRE